MSDQISAFWNQHSITLKQSTLNHTLLAFQQYLKPPNTPKNWFDGVVNHINNIKSGYVWPTPEMNETSAALFMLKLQHVAAVRLSLNNIGKLSFEHLDENRVTITTGPFDKFEDIVYHCQKVGIKSILKYNMSTEKVGIIGIEQNFKTEKFFKIENYCLGSNRSNSSVEITSLNCNSLFDRKPLQFALLVDCSGSMTGQKMINMKKTLVQMAKSAKSMPNILFDIIPFDDKLLYDVFPLTKSFFNTKDDKFFQSFENMVETLKACHSTNFCDPIKEAVKKIDNLRETHIILFTDGFANSGLSSAQELKSFISMIIPSCVNFHIFGIGESYNSEICISMIDGHDVPSDTLIHLTGTESTVEVPVKFMTNVLGSFARYVKIKLSPESTLLSKKPYITWPQSNQSFTNILFSRTNETKYAEITVHDFLNTNKKYFVLELPPSTSTTLDDFLVDFEVSLLLKAGDLTRVDESTVKVFQNQHSNIPTTVSNMNRKLKLQKTLDMCNLSQGNQRTVNLYNISTNSTNYV
jgi:hypothetical protein